MIRPELAGFENKKCKCILVVIKEEIYAVFARSALLTDDIFNHQRMTIQLTNKRYWLLKKNKWTCLKVYFIKMLFRSVNLIFS